MNEFSDLYPEGNTAVPVAALARPLVRLRLPGCDIPADQRQSRRPGWGRFFGRADTKGV